MVVPPLLLLTIGCGYKTGGSDPNSVPPVAQSSTIWRPGEAVGGASAPLAKAVPFDLDANKIFLQVRINHAGLFWFQLDSGSVYNVLDKDAAKSLAIKLHGHSTVRGAGESLIDAAQASGVSLQVGGIELKGLDFTVLPLNSSLSSSEGHEIDGLLGYEFIRRYCVAINYFDRVLDVYAPGACPPANGKGIPIEIRNDAIYVSGTLLVGKDEQVQGRFLVDTGFRNALVLNEPFVRAHDLLNRAGRTIETRMGVSLGGETRGMIGRLPGLQLGSILIKEPVIAFSEMKYGVLASENFSGVIGGDILRRFRVVLDCPGGRMILEPNGQTEEPFEFDMSGILLSAEGASLKTFRVVRVLVQSPAAEAGVRANDIVESVDGLPSSSLSLEQISHLFKDGAGRTHRLVLKRGQQELQTSIKLRRLV